MLSLIHRPNCDQKLAEGCSPEARWGGSCLLSSGSAFLREHPSLLRK